MATTWLIWVVTCSEYGPRRRATAARDGRARNGQDDARVVDCVRTGLGPVLEFHTRSDHQARDTLYEFDYLLRFYHAQVHDSERRTSSWYIRWHALGEAIRSPTPRVVIIDEVDKAPRDFPNDLLDELDGMEFRVPELDVTYESSHRPIVVITSNSERQLPDRFCDAVFFTASNSRPESNCSGF